MTHQALEISIRDYVRSIDLLLDEGELRDRNYEISTYFDAAEVRNALLGAEALVPGTETWNADTRGQRTVEVFEDPRTLVQMLFSSGFLGPVRLLPPHQSELLSQITDKFKNHDHTTFGRASDRLNMVVQKATIETDPSADLVTSARQRAEEAMRKFTLDEARRSPWSRRLSRWKGDGILDLETIVPDSYSAILDMPEFGIVERALAASRSDLPRNNFSDAAALMIVASTVAKASERKTRQLPLLYLSPGALLSTVELNAVARNKLMFKMPDSDRKMSVLRDWKYMVVRATLTPASAGPANVKELRKLREQLRQISSTSSRISSQLLITLSIGDEEVTERVDTFFDLCFFLKVWRPYCTLVETEATVEDDALTSEDSLNKANEALQQVKIRIEQNVAEYVRLDKLWITVHDAAMFLSQRVSSHDIDFVRAFGAFRFVPSPDAATRADLLLTRIVADVAPRGDGPPENRESSLAQLITYYERAKSRTISPEDLGVLAIAFWSLGLNGLIDEALARYDGSDWLSVLRAAAQLRASGKAGVVDRVLEALKTAQRKPGTSQAEKIRLAIAIGYLSFHAALVRNYQPFWVRRITGQASSEASVQLIENAIKCARQTVELTRDDGSVLHVYALNQSLYYLVAAGSGSRDELRTLSNQLLLFAAKPQLWDFRYDDTVARYFFWASATAPTDETIDRKLHLANMSQQHIELAVAQSHGDHEVALFRSLLANYHEELLPGQKTTAATGTRPSSR